MQVRHILHGKGRDVVSIAAGATLTEAAKLLTDRKIGALIVKNKNGSSAASSPNAIWCMPSPAKVRRRCRITSRRI